MSLILKGIDLPNKGDILTLDIYSDGHVRSGRQSESYCIRTDAKESSIYLKQSGNGVTTARNMTEKRIAVHDIRKSFARP